MDLINEIRQMAKESIDYQKQNFLLVTHYLYISINIYLSFLKIVKIISKLRCKVLGFKEQDKGLYLYIK